MTTPVWEGRVMKLDQLGVFYDQRTTVGIMGRLMGVNPFDQPGVEEGKVLARKYLESSAR